MPDYLRRFNALVKSLEECSYIEVMEYQTHPGARAADLSEARKLLEVPLAESICSFYKQTNGMKLHWRITPDLSVAETQRLRKISSDYYVVIAEYVDDPFAMIDLMPIQDVFADRQSGSIADPQAGERITIHGVDYTMKDFRKRLRPFDLINPDSCMALILERGNGNPPVLYLNGGCSQWAGSATDFGSYMEMLLATRGIVEAREKIFGAGGKGVIQSAGGSSGYWGEHHTPKMFAKSD
jgi:hypothetical protein